MQRAFNPEKINYGAYSDKLSHLHFHLAPKYVDGPDYGGTFQMNPGKVYLKDEEYQQLIDQLWKKSQQYLMWYCSLDGYRFDGSQRDCMINIYAMNQLVDLQTSIDEKKGAQKDQQLEGLIQLYHSKGGRFEQ
jgi:hypothetical protein